MEHKTKITIVVKSESAKTRSGWHGVKPYTRVQTPKTVYNRKGRQSHEKCK